MAWNTNPMRRWRDRGSGSRGGESNAGAVELGKRGEKPSGPQGVIPQPSGGAGRPDAWQSVSDGKAKRGIPVRESLQTMYALRRDKSFRELLLYTIFFVLFIIVSQMMIDIHTAYEQNDAVIDRLFDEEMQEEGGTYKKNYYDIMTTEEYWEWLEGPVLRGLFPMELYNGEPLPRALEGYTLDFLRVVGQVQLRQVRSRNDSCTGRRFVHQGDRFDTKDGTCFAYFSASDTESRLPFGPGGRYTWSGGWSSLSGLSGFEQEYGTGGFVAYLPPNQTEAAARIASLKQNLWIDRSTRVVALNANLYNTNTRLLTVVRAVVEFFPSGRVLPWYRVYATVPALYYVNGLTDTFRQVMEATFICMLVYYMQKEAKRVYWTQPHWRYFTRVRNLFEVLSLTSALAMVVCQLVLIADPLRQNFSAADPQYVDYFHVAQLTELVLVFSAVFSLTSFLKVFKYTSLNKRMNTLWLTLYSAFNDLVAFILAYLFILLGFSYAGFLIFGSQLRDFHNFVTSFSTLNRYILGDFNYRALWDARPLLAAPFFGLYTVLVLLTVTNIFIAVLTRNFEAVQLQAEEESQWHSAVVTIESSTMRRLWRLYRRVFQRDASWTQDEIGEWRRRQAFRRQLARVMSQCKRGKGLDLYEYFHRLFRESDAENQYIGVHELCAIVRSTQECDHSCCDAGRLVALYHELKDVVLVDGSSHIPSSYSARTLAGHDIYRVEKVNKEGKRQTRLMVVDRAAYEVRSYDTSRRYRKTLFLGDLCQIERSRANLRRISLVFRGKQTPYTLVFHDFEERDKFMASALDTANAATANPHPETILLTGDSARCPEADLLRDAAHSVRISSAQLLGGAVGYNPVAGGSASADGPASTGTGNGDGNGNGKSHGPLRHPPSAAAAAAATEESKSQNGDEEELLGAARVPARGPGPTPLTAAPAASASRSLSMRGAAAVSPWRRAQRAVRQGKPAAPPGSTLRKSTGIGAAARAVAAARAEREGGATPAAAAPSLSNVTMSLIRAQRWRRLSAAKGGGSALRTAAARLGDDGEGGGGGAAAAGVADLRGEMEHRLSALAAQVGELSSAQRQQEALLGDILAAVRGRQQGE